jgi:hypothetical protein
MTATIELRGMPIGGSGKRRSADLYESAGLIENVRRTRWRRSRRGLRRRRGTSAKTTLSLGDFESGFQGNMQQANVGR